LYYIGYEDSTPNYENHIGGTKQKNPAHFVELAAALSIIDFAKQDQNTLTQRGSRFLEFGLNEFQNTIDFKTLGSVTSKTIFSYLCKFYLFNLYLEKQINKSINKQPWSNKGKIKIPKSFMTSENGFFEKVTKTHNRFTEWLSELSQNSPSFKPFNLGLSKDGALNCVSNIEPNRKFSWKKDFVLFDDLLNASVNKTQNLSQEQKFIELFNIATNNLFTKLYN
jgi:hypothetical protein